MLLSEGKNIIIYAGNNAYKNIDPSGLWQITITMGAGPAIRVTFGKNQGQWNTGMFLGGGVGGSFVWDPNPTECQKPNIEYGALVEGEFGAGVAGIGGNAYDSTNGSQFGFDAGVPGTPAAVSWGLKNWQFNPPNVTVTVGGSTFTGVGSTTYYPPLNLPDWEWQ